MIKLDKFFLVFLCLVFSSVSAIENPNSVFVVTFNAENLFDNIDDLSNPRDDTYLPIKHKDKDKEAHDKKCEELNQGFYKNQCIELDWNEEVFHAKLENYANVIKAMPHMPEILIIPETENKDVLETLVDKFLTNSGYSVVQLDTTDKPSSRGIDVGLLTTLKVKSSQAHKIDFKRDNNICGKTRDILAVSLELPDGKDLHVFGVHFPSGRSPVKCRYRAFQKLNELQKALPEGSMKIAAGDFNFNCNETSSAAFFRLLQRGGWYSSPVINNNCLSPGTSKFTERLIDYWHTWSYLDNILISKELSLTKPFPENWFADLGSFQTLVVDPNQYMLDEDAKGYIEPRRFDPITKSGVSDHWPVGLRLLNRKVNNVQNKTSFERNYSSESINAINLNFSIEKCREDFSEVYKHINKKNLDVKCSDLHPKVKTGYIEIQEKISINTFFDQVKSQFGFAKLSQVADCGPGELFNEIEKNCPDGGDGGPGVLFNEINIATNLLENGSTIPMNTEFFIPSNSEYYSFTNKFGNTGVIQLTKKY